MSKCENQLNKENSLHKMNFNDKAKPIALKAKTSKSAVAIADKHLQATMRGEHKVMATRWQRVNKMLLGGFHFKQIYFIPGASGHGKSYLLNMLHKDFTNRALNDHKFSFKVLHFGFEMNSEVEVLRSLSAMAKIPYRKLIASDDPLTESEYIRAQNYYTQLEENPIYFFEDPGTRLQIEATIRAFHLRFPDDELIVTLDHSLLVLSEPREDEVKTLSELGKMFIRLKKEMGLLTILLGQLNDKIEGERRRDPTNPALHFPTKTDIHGSKQLYHASDAVIVIHQPSLLNLEYYGKQNIPTKDLIVLHLLKQRNGAQGFVLMDNLLSQGELLERRKDKDEKNRQEIRDQLVGSTRS